MGLINSDLRVLVIDANAHIRKLIATLLGALAIKDVAEARNTEAAVPLMIRKAPDLIIADWTADPTEILLFVHRIRHGGLVHRRTPVLALSHSTHHAVLERAEEAGIDDVIAKPLSAKDVIHRSALLINSWRRVEHLADVPAE